MKDFDPLANDWLGSLSRWLYNSGQMTAGELSEVADLMLTYIAARDAKLVDQAYRHALSIIKEAKEKL